MEGTSGNNKQRDRKSLQKRRRIHSFFRSENFCKNRNIHIVIVMEIMRNDDKKKMIIIAMMIMIVIIVIVTKQS